MTFKLMAHITIQIPKITIQNYNQQMAQNHNQQ